MTTFDFWNNRLEFTGQRDTLAPHFKRGSSVQASGSFTTPGAACLSN